MARPIRFNYEESLALLRDLADLAPDLHWDRAKMKIQSSDFDGEQGFEFRLPWPMPVPEADQDFADYIEDLEEEPPAFYLILMQAGHSALGYFESGELVFHKVIKKYMVRRKQGKAQIGHLSTRGKSKAGSRIRLANTVQFFEDINAKLEEWALEDEVSRIMVSVPVRMWSLWFGSRVPVPFEREDPRLTKVPLDVQRPGLDELRRVGMHACNGHLIGHLPY